MPEKPRTADREISDRLRRAGFAPDDNAAGNPTRQRWKIVRKDLLKWRTNA